MTRPAAPVQQPSANDHMIVTADLPDLSPAAAFDACTRPELITQWWPQEAEIDGRTGGAYRLLWPAMGWELTGRFIEFEPGQKLTYTWSWTQEPDLPERLVSIDFAPRGAGSSLVVRHGDYGDSAAEQDDRQSHIDGWVYFLGRLQQLGSLGS